MKEVPVYVIVLQVAVDTDQVDDPINWPWRNILDLRGVHHPEFVTGGVLGHREISET